MAMRTTVNIYPAVCSRSCHYFTALLPPPLNQRFLWLNLEHVHTCIMIKQKWLEGTHPSKSITYEMAVLECTEIQSRDSFVTRTFEDLMNATTSGQQISEMGRSQGHH